MSNNDTMFIDGEFEGEVFESEKEEGKMNFGEFSVVSLDANLSTRKSFPGFTNEENALLNLEVTDEIEDLIFALAKDKGLTAEPMVEDVLFDDVAVSEKSPIDYERVLNGACPVFDKYFAVSEQLDELFVKSGWETLRSNRQHLWSLFQEEMDTNWLNLQVLEQKADHRLFVLGKEGKAPSDDQWKAFMANRRKTMQTCYNMQNDRYAITRSLYDRAIQATNVCKAFWKTDMGLALNSLKQERQDLYDELNVLREINGITVKYWDYVVSYWQLRNEEISKYFTNGETNSVDDPEMIEIARDPIEGMIETHLKEMAEMERGDTYWMNWYDTWLSKREDRKQEESNDYLAYVDSLVNGDVFADLE